MVDTNFIAAFANNPLTLSILMIAAIIVVVIWKVSPFFKDILEKMDSGNKDLADRITTVIASDAEQAKTINDMSEHIRLNTLDVLRITVYNESVDPEDRLVAAKRYFVRGGNGKVASYVKRLIDQYPEQWKTILAMVTLDERAQLEKIIAEAV